MPKADSTINSFWSRRLAIFAGLLSLVVVVLTFFFSSGSSAQTVILSPSIFRVGEKLNYNISFGKIRNAGYAETHVVSRGKISGKDAVEVRGRLKTIDLVSAAFFLLDESRTAFAAPDTGLPHYVTTSSLVGVTPKETVRNYLSQPTSSFDLLTLMYRAREAGGVGTFPMFEGDAMHTVSFQGAVPEKVKTDAGEFDTTVAIVQSDFLTASGIKEIKINFSVDEFHIPVLLRLKTVKGDFKVILSAIALPESETPSPTPTPAVVPTQTPAVKPSPTPVQYVDNQPLIPELGFAIGEVLDYRISAAGKAQGILTLNALERKMFEKRDSLLLTATITGVEPGSTAFKLGDAAVSHVDPDTLLPRRLESKFAYTLTGLNQIVTFDPITGAINFGGRLSIDAPIGTHSFVSLIYAMRSFNLKPSLDRSNPVNDTRVAVFWESRSYVFTLRPSQPTEITINGENVSAQLITINTGNKELDALSLKVWLSTDDRIPLRFSAGIYQADLIRAANL